jgi:putative ABC transport system permease protein
MDSLLQDLRYTVRTLRGSPGFALAAVLTLALGVGGGTTVFSVVNAVLLRPLPFPEPDRLQLVWTQSDERPQSWLSYPEWGDLRERSTTFQDLAAVRDWSFNVTGAEEPERVSGLAVSANLFSVLGVGPVIGRAFLPEEDRIGAGRVAILSHGFWQRRFGADPGLVGRTVALDGEQFTVVGVLPREFRLLPPSSVFPGDAAVLVPLEPALGTGFLRNRDVRHLHVLGRLAPGATAAEARAEVAGIGARLRAENTAGYTSPGWGMTAVGYHEQIVQGVRPALLMLFGAVGLLLLLVTVNVANLLLARHAARAREMGVRAALGASRSRLVRLRLIESLVLAVLGGAAGVLLALHGIELLRTIGPGSLPRLDEVGVDASVLGFSLLLTLGTAVLCGLLPALQTARSDGGELLRDGGRSNSAGASRGRTRSSLVVSQVALALVLLVGAGLLLRSLLHLQAEPLGFEPARVLTLQLSFAEARYPTGQARGAFLTEAEERLRALPGVQAVGAVTQLPLSGAHLGSGFFPEAGAATGEDRSVSADLRGITPGYFDAMGIRLRRGRSFSAADGREAPWVGVIDETLAARLWPGEDPLGKRIRWQRAEQPIEIVGVVAAVAHAGIGAGPRETVYRPYAQYAPGTPVFLAMRSDGDPAALAGAVRRTLHRIDPDQPIGDLRSMRARVADALGEPRFYALLLGGFAAFALLLAAIGIYGVVSYGVAQRTREIGIRTALGAGSGEVLRMVVAEGLRLAVVGVALGLVAALVATRVLSSLLYEVETTDPLVFVLVPLFLAGVALLASYLPARRASRVDPMIALRSE